MTRFAGRDSYVAVDDSGGTLRNISPHVSSIDFPLDVAEIDVTGLGTVGRNRIAGHEDSQVTVRAHFDDTATTGSHAVLSGIPGLIGTIEFGPKGNTGGFPKLTGEFLCTNVTYSTSVDGGVEINATFMLANPTAGFTVTTF